MRWHQCTANATICKFRCFMNISNAALQNGTLDPTAEVPEGERWERWEKVEELHLMQ